MTPLAAKYRGTTDDCVRCSDQPTVAPDGMGSTTDSEHIVLAYRCRSGHCWQRTWARSDLKRGPAKATTAPRRHLTTTTTATTTADHEDAPHLSKATRQPSPRTTWHPTRRLWEPR